MGHGLLWGHVYFVIWSFCRTCCVLTFLSWQRKKSGLREHVGKWQSQGFAQVFLAWGLFFFLFLQIGFWKDLFKSSLVHPYSWIKRLILTSTKRPIYSGIVNKNGKDRCGLIYSSHSPAFYPTPGVYQALSRPQEGWGCQMWDVSGPHWTVTGSWFLKLVLFLGRRQ